MIPIDIIHKVYNATCAVGVITAPSLDDLLQTHKTGGFEIIGSGFLCRSTTVITNRHVVEAMNAYLAQHSLSDNRMAAQFNFFIGDGMEQCYAPITRLCVVKQPVEADIALFEVERLDEDPEDFKEAVQPLTIIENVKSLELGQEIGIAGFPYGQVLHADPHADAAIPIADRNVVRMGPILQQGIISGFRPWQRTYGIREILLDARIAGGMSGSPVFWQQSGTVVGVVYGTHETVVGHAVPIDSIRVTAWCGMIDSGKTDLVEAQIKYIEE